MIKIIILFVLTLLSFNVLADMPYITNNVAMGHERIQDGDKVCETSTPTTTINAGVYGNNGDQYDYRDQDKGGYIGISIPIGGTPKIDCNSLYEKMLKTKDMENEQKSAQIEILKQQLQAANENLRLQGGRAITAN